MGVLESATNGHSLRFFVFDFQLFWYTLANKNDRNFPKTKITLFMKKLLCSVLQRLSETDATLQPFEVPEIFILKFNY